MKYPLEDVSEAEEIMTERSTTLKKKKKKKSKDGIVSSEKKIVGNMVVMKKNSLNDSLGGLSLQSLESKRSVLGSPQGSPKKLFTVSHEDYDKFSVGFFEAVLEEIRLRCQRKLKLKTKDQEAFAMTCQNYYDTWSERVENDELLAQLFDESNTSSTPRENRETEELIKTKTRLAKELNKTILKRKQWCVKSALTVFMGLKEDSLEGLEERIVKGAIIAQATPEKLAEFASRSKTNKKLLKHLFGDTSLMKDMLLNGGASKYEYGEAIRIYVECMGVEKAWQEKNKNEFDPYTQQAWDNVHKKIALACSLELASPMYEFDSTNTIDPVERYKHFVDAHRAGELDPAFPHFSVWEMRQIVNCDAPNEQMSWCRRMVMNYAPHLTCLTDHEIRYIYLLQSDVRIRKPEWTSSPRTYPMVLSGGGNESVNSWFGRFMLKSFGLPSWGSKSRRKEGFTRWTPNGWKALNGADWESASWQGKTGKDFKMETEARNKAPEKEYFKRLVSLQCLADIIDGDPNSIPDGEKDVLHPERMWRSLSIVSMDLLFQTEPEVARTFQRSGESLVSTKCERYLKKYETDEEDDPIAYYPKSGEVIVPASRHGYSDGRNVIVIESFTGKKQLNFTSSGRVEYELPDNMPSKRYHLICEVCTVSSQQSPLMAEIGDDPDAEPIEITIPYTKGEWAFTIGISAKIEAGSTLKLYRPDGSMGLAIKKILLR